MTIGDVFNWVGSIKLMELFSTIVILYGFSLVVRGLLWFVKK